MYLALKEIKREKTRFIMIVLVTALIAYLVYFLAALAFGLAQLNKTAVDHWNAQGVIVSKASNQNIYASSIDLDRLESMGLDNKDAINVASTTVYVNKENENNQKPLNIVLIGYNTDNTKIVAPIIEGRNINNSNEITISSNFREKIDLKLNDTIEIAKTGRVFKVVGFTEDSNYNTIPVAYVSQEMASLEMMQYTTGDSEVDAVSSPTPNMPNRVSAVIIKESNFKETLSSDYEYVDITNFINKIPGYQAQVLTFGFMIVALSLISSIVIGIFMYILTMQKKSIFGVLKIQGYRNSYIIQSVICQSIVLMISGFLLGLLLTVITVNLLPSSVPVQIMWELNLVATVFAFICSIIGSLFSAKSILRIDPLEVL